MSVLTAVLAGVLGLLAGLALEHFRRSSTDRRWLLDRRHEDVVAFLTEANACSRLFRLGRTPSPERLAAMRTAEQAYFGAAITSSAEVEALVETTYSALADIGDATTAVQRERANDVFVARVRTVVAAARAETQPAPREVSWWQRLRRQQRRGRI